MKRVVKKVKKSDCKIGENKLMIRNSTAEFLMFTSDVRGAGGENIEVRFEDKMIWLTQGLIAKLFDKGRSTVTEHLNDIFNEGELNEISVCREFRRTGTDSKNYNVKYYNLDAIIAVGYRVNSERATMFRQWATKVLSQFAQRGYVVDKKRMENGTFLSEEYFDELLQIIRDIRSSERKFYQKITDIYATSLDYDSDNDKTKKFFQTVQNKLHYAIHGQTASELIVSRASASKRNMGLMTWARAPKGKIIKNDVAIAKNYLEKEEVENLNRIVGVYLDLAEDLAVRKIPMTMKDWTERLNEFLKFSRRDILDNPGKISAAVAKSFAETEFEKYRIIQDKIYKSDFDNFLQEMKDDIMK